MAMLIGKRARIFKFIHEFMQDKGYPPTVREIQRACGLASPRTVQYHLEVLKQEGLIQRIPHTARGIHLAEGQPNTEEVPLMGTISAGQPIPVPDNNSWASIPQEIIVVPQHILRGRNQTFALRVKGRSMIDALIDDGDIVLIEPTRIVDNGELVAVWLSDRQEVTLKKIYMEPGRVRLQPANIEMRPIYADPEYVNVQGKVIGVIREYRH